MTLLQSVLCLVGRHQPDRKAVHWDGEVYRGTCTGCGSRILRHSRRTWRRDEAG